MSLTIVDPAATGLEYLASVDVKFSGIHIGGGIYFSANHIPNAGGTYTAVPQRSLNGEAEAHATSEIDVTLPADPAGRARVRALSYMIACEVHPLNNLRVLQYLASELDADDQDRTAWFHHWVHATFTPLEKLLAESADTGIFCHGDVPGLADCCLYAQMWNNRRFKVNTSAYPTIERIFLELDKLEPFRLAAPPTQPDAA